VFCCCINAISTVISTASLKADTYRDDRDWEVDKLGRRHVGRWERCRYLIGVTPIIVRTLVEPEKVAELV